MDIDIIKYLNIIEKVIVAAVSMAILGRFTIYVFNKDTDSLSIANNVFKAIIFVLIFTIICVLNRWNFPYETIKIYLILIAIILGLALLIILAKKGRFNNKLDKYRDPVTGRVDKELFEQDNFYKINKFTFIFLIIIFIMVIVARVLFKLN